MTVNSVKCGLCAVSLAASAALAGCGGERDIQEGDEAYVELPSEPRLAGVVSSANASSGGCAGEWSARCIKVEDARLVFRDMASYEEAVAHLAREDAPLDAWEPQFAGFMSMRSAYENLASTIEGDISREELEERFGRFLTVRGDDDNSEALMLTEEPPLAALFNDEGVLQIGEDLYKLTYENLYRVDARDAWAVQQMRQLRGPLPQGAEFDAQVSPISRYESALGSEASLLAKVDTCSSEYKHGGKYKRLKGELFNTAVGSLYSSAGARTKHQIRTLGIWWRDKTQQLRLAVSGSYTPYLQGIPLPVVYVSYDSGWQYDDGREAYTFDFCVNVSCLFDLHQINGAHSAVCDDGVARACSTHAP